MLRNSLLFILNVLALASFGQFSAYNNQFDYKNINTATFIPSTGRNNDENYSLTVLKHSFEMQQMNSHIKDTTFRWDGLAGFKTICSKDSLRLFFIRPDDSINRPCILLTHGSNAKYSSRWNEWLNFYTIDLAMRGYCVAYYENPSSFESKLLNAQYNNTRKAFYNGFQSAVAATLYVMHRAADLHIDTTKLFSGGHSFGAFCALSLAGADTGANFTDSLFAGQGGFNEKSVYPDAYTKPVVRAFAIGGALPKDDTTGIHNSRMGNFLDERDAGLSVLFMHGRTDNFISFDINRIGDLTTPADWFFAEGPRALLNNIEKKETPVPARLWVNCKAGHSFLSSVCGDSQPSCIAQYQWPYLSEPPAGLPQGHPYFSNPVTDTLLHYFSFMMAQINEMGLLTCDFLQPAVLNTPSFFPNTLYFVQPLDSFTYESVNGYYTLKNTDCEGNLIVVSGLPEPQLNGRILNLYPNPANHYLTVETNSGFEKISLYNLLGERAAEVTAGDGFKQTVCISNLSNGEYIVIAQFRESVLTRKISVIH